MSGQARLLVVDDEPSLQDIVATSMRFLGYEVSVATTGREAVRAANELRPDLIILDVMLPDFDGFEVASRLRRRGRSVPIVFLTARDETGDKVRGLTIGGDDYVTKPFSVEELTARIRAVLRRHGAEGPASRMSFEDLELDEDTREVHRAGQLVELTDTEFRLLRYLMANPGIALSRAQLLDRVWGYDFGGDARVLETYVSYLRKKLDPLGPPLIHTVRSVGYSLRRPRG